MSGECSKRSFNEDERLAALRGYDILDTPVESEFDDFTRLASYICQAPVSLISLVDKDRQWFKSTLGIAARETELDRSICRHAILQEGVFVVPDTARDPRFADNPLVTGDPHFRFYAGATLETKSGFPLGTLCVLDHQPRTLSEAQIEALQMLARQVMTALELRKAAEAMNVRNRELAQAMQEIKTLEGLLPICSRCKQIRAEDSKWMAVEVYVEKHTNAQFSHGLCPECVNLYLEDLNRMKLK